MFDPYVLNVARYEIDKDKQAQNDVYCLFSKSHSLGFPYCTVQYKGINVIGNLSAHQSLSFFLLTLELVLYKAGPVAQSVERWGLGGRNTRPGYKSPGF